MVSAMFAVANIILLAAILIGTLPALDQAGDPSFYTAAVGVDFGIILLVPLGRADSKRRHDDGGGGGDGGSGGDWGDYGVGDGGGGD